MINLHVDSKNTRQYNVYLFAISTVPLCSLESRRTLALRKQDSSQMELLESRPLSDKALLDIVDLEDNI